MKNQIGKINNEVEGYSKLVNFTKKIFDRFYRTFDVPFDKPFVMMKQLSALLRLSVINQFILCFFIY